LVLDALEAEKTERLAGTFGYEKEIRHGLKHDAEGVFGLRIVRSKGSSLVVRAKGGRADEAGPAVEVERELVYPYLKPRHVKRWAIAGWEHVLVPQKRAGERNSSELAGGFPKTLAYLESHRPRLQKRRSSIFKSGPFYSVFGLGPYTFSPFRVVWCGLGMKACFAVVTPVEDPSLGNKPPVPDSCCYSISTGSFEEACFLAGVLNSSVVKWFLESRPSGSKRPLSKTALSRVGVPRFDPERVEMRAIAERAGELVERAKGGASGPAAGSGIDLVEKPELESELDELVAELLGF
jgi:hypothetical protein